MPSWCNRIAGSDHGKQVRREAFMGKVVVHATGDGDVQPGRALNIFSGAKQTMPASL